jgi:hypothetical protein
VGLRLTRSECDVRRAMSGNQQAVLIVLIRQTQRAQEDAKSTRVYIQDQAHEPYKPLQGLDGDPSQEKKIFNRYQVLPLSIYNRLCHCIPIYYSRLMDA